MSYGLKEIAQDLLSGKLPASASKDLVKERLKVCTACPEFSGKVLRKCNLCGCFMDIKVTMLEATCPAGKW